MLAKLGLGVPDLARAVQKQSTVNPSGQVGAEPAAHGRLAEGVAVAGQVAGARVGEQRAQRLESGERLLARRDHAGAAPFERAQILLRLLGAAADGPARVAQDAQGVLTLAGAEEAAETRRQRRHVGLVAHGHHEGRRPVDDEVDVGVLGPVQDPVAHVPEERQPMQERRVAVSDAGGQRRFAPAGEGLAEEGLGVGRVGPKRLPLEARELVAGHGEDLAGDRHRQGVEALHERRGERVVGLGGMLRPQRAQGRGAVEPRAHEGADLIAVERRQRRAVAKGAIGVGAAHRRLEAVDERALDRADDEHVGVGLRELGDHAAEAEERIGVVGARLHRLDLVEAEDDRQRFARQPAQRRHHLARVVLAIVGLGRAHAQRRQRRFGEALAAQPRARVGDVAAVDEVADDDAQAAPEPQQLRDIVGGRGHDAHALDPATDRLAARRRDLVRDEADELAHALVLAEQVVDEAAADEAPDGPRARLQLGRHEDAVKRAIGRVGRRAVQVSLHAGEEVGLARAGDAGDEDRIGLAAGHARERGEAGLEGALVDRFHVGEGQAPGVDDHGHREGVGQVGERAGRAHGRPRSTAPT